MGTFAYRIFFSGSRLCFGVSVGIKYYEIDWNALHPRDIQDKELSPDTRNPVVPDADFGIYYYSSRFYAGVSSKHLFQNQMVVSSAVPDSGNAFTRLLRNFYATAGADLKITEEWNIRPSILLKYVANAPLQADISLCFAYKNLFTLGASYRTDKAVALIVEMGIGKGVSVGYSYDIWFNSLIGLNRGSHEIRIGYDLDLEGRSRMLTPRFF
jgi:type IX secretion system PorP/SprF family membrane protein